MLLWKKIQEKWHLTYEDIPICRLALLLATQSHTKICPSCVDSLADARTQWQSLNLK